MPNFIRDVQEIRERASRSIEEGAVTPSYAGDVNKSIQILNEALATEIVCVLRYMHHYFMATGVHGRSVADEFKEHADSEREHADMIAERIQQLGGKPDYNPRTLLERSVSQYVEGETLAEMIQEDLIAERIVIEVYGEMIRFFADKDPTTRRIIERILEDEEDHASELADLLFVVNPSTGETKGPAQDTHSEQKTHLKPTQAAKHAPQAIPKSDHQGERVAASSQQGNRGRAHDKQQKGVQHGSQHGSQQGSQRFDPQSNRATPDANKKKTHRSDGGFTAFDNMTPGHLPDRADRTSGEDVKAPVAPQPTGGKHREESQAERRWRGGPRKGRVA